ncbi:hypothetical protein GPJ56_004608 [Histomonas meleagridis]|uniref:uncharacterized protein n=1 Tax=Histomonas meleagridis TaxID=135588 RepID=UPI0035599011|nr:hypothetical protein GPJ56_004608 [Histomonas meleagridis]KAH0804864.1 hypothetical protein GO595_002338 [Histomonas meleagridis]
MGSHKISSDEEQREFKRSNSKPLISSSPSEQVIPKKATLYQVKSSLLSTRSLFISAFLTISLITTCFANVYMGSRVVNMKSLPDVIADLAPSFALYRSSGFLTYFGVPGIITIILISSCVYYTYNCYNISNIRRSLMLFGLSLLFRSLCSTFTTIAPPCTGYANCNCLINFGNIIKKHSVLKIALVYFFTFGYGTKSIPSCNNAFMSAMFSFQMCLFLHVYSIQKKTISKDKLRGFTFLFSVLLFTSAVSSILIRNESTVSIVLSLVFTLLVNKLMWCDEEMVSVDYGPFVTSSFGRFFTWLNANEPEMSMRKSHDNFGDKI